MGSQAKSDIAHSKESILVVEDDEIFRVVIRRFLESHGLTVREAENGLVAKTILELTPHSTIISDVRMPFMGGLKLLEFAKKRLPESKFILMTGFAEALEAKEAHALGADGFLPKPFRREELLKLLKVNGVVPGGTDPSEPLNNEHGIDMEYCQIEITDFVTGTALPADIFLRLASDKLIKLAVQGQAVPVDRIQLYQSKGIHHLYMRKEDFARYVGLNMKIFNVAHDMPHVEVQKKIFLFKHVTETVLEQLCVHGMDRKGLNETSVMVMSAVDLLTKGTDTVKLMDVLLSAQSLSDHAMAVAMIAVLIGQECGYRAKSTSFKLTLAGLFHDIGTRELPEELLSKRRFEMSVDERRLFESHPVRGREILQSVPGLPEDVTCAAAQHHESFSGTGYPQRLRTDQIHPIARIIAVADTFCELVLTVPGRRGMSAEQAFETLRTEYQRDLDPQFVKALGIAIDKMVPLDPDKSA